MLPPYAICVAMATTLAMKLGHWPLRRRADEARAGQATFETLIQQCWDQLWRYAYRVTGNRDDAEDLLSESLVEGFRSFPQFRGETSFCRWMYRVMTTTRIDMVRRASRRRTESLDVGTELEAGRAAPWQNADRASDPEAIVVQPMLSEEVQQALDALPEEFRSVVILADMEQMDYADVSHVLGIPVGTVRSRLHRARHALRRSLAKHLGAA
jgi:RNA polymerase sigma-70 factor, ECF subfamily